MNDIHRNSRHQEQPVLVSARIRGPKPSRTTGPRVCKGPSLWTYEGNWPSCPHRNSSSAGRRNNNKTLDTSRATDHAPLENLKIEIPSTKVINEQLHAIREDASKERVEKLKSELRQVLTAVGKTRPTTPEMLTKRFDEDSARKQDFGTRCTVKAIVTSIRPRHGCSTAHIIHTGEYLP